MRKIWITGVIAAACILAGTVTKCEAKTDEKIVVAGGGEKVISTDVYKTKTSVNNRKKVKVYKQFLDASDKISILADKPNKALFIKGISDGKARVTVKTTTGKTVYNITVLPKEKVKKKAQKMLKKVVKNKRGIYDDFNQDGIEEYYSNGKIFYYDYEKNKVITKRFFTEKENSKIQKIYYSPKRHLFYAEMEGKTAVHFVLVDREKIIGRVDREIRFLKVKDKKGKINYILNDESYDQDDYWYRPYTEEEMNKFLKKQIPDAKEINFRG